MDPAQFIPDYERLVTFEEKVDAFVFAINFLAGSTDAFDKSVAAEGCRRFLRQHTGKTIEKESFPLDVIRAAWLGQGKLCGYCGKPMTDPRDNGKYPYALQTTGDHLDPESNGGLTVPDNCLAVHGRCNSLKGTLNPVALAKRLNTTILEILKRMRVGEGDSQ